MCTTMRYPRRPARRLPWRTELKLCALRYVTRAEKALHRLVRWALPIREILMWAPVVGGVTGLLFGVCLRILLP